MRGLTRVERECLLSGTSAEARDPENDLAGPDERAICDALLAQGRLCLVNREDDYYWWTEWQTTDLGRLALRVCPPEES